MQAAFHAYEKHNERVGGALGVFLEDEEDEEDDFPCDDLDPAASPPNPPPTSSSREPSSGTIPTPTPDVPSRLPEVSGVVTMDEIIDALKKCTTELPAVLDLLVACLQRERVDDDELIAQLEQEMPALEKRFREEFIAGTTREGKKAHMKRFPECYRDGERIFS